MKITLESDGAPAGTKITDQAGLAVHGVKAVTWMCQVDQPAKAFIEFSLITLKSVEAEAQALIEGRSVRRIEYVDGSIDEFPSGESPK